MIVYKEHHKQDINRLFIRDLIDFCFLFPNHRPYFNRPGSLDKHRHVQALTGTFPIEDTKLNRIGNSCVLETDRSVYPSNVFVVESEDYDLAADTADLIVKTLDSKQKEGSEKFKPLYLIFANKGKKTRIFIFPKKKWRADSFPNDMSTYETAPEKERTEFVITPASVETGGRGSTSDKSTFDRMTKDAYYNILEQTDAPYEELDFVRQAIIKNT